MSKDFASCDNLNKVEDEYHFFLKCSFYDELRVDAFPRLNQPLNSIKDIQNFFRDATFKEINIFSKFVKESFEKRQNATKLQENIRYIVVM